MIRMGKPSRSIAMFNINWTKKTKIVVDGKEYERLDDLPEHLRSLLKDRDGDGIPDVAAQGKKTWGFEPVIKVNFHPGEPLEMDPNVPVTLPDGFRFDDNGSERRISWRWFSLGIIGALFFVALWDGIAGFTLRAALSTKNLPLPALLVLLLLAICGIAMTYGVIAYLVNRTIIHLDPARLSVEHGPLPWFGAKDIPKVDISRVWSEKVGQASDDDTMFEPSVTYRVKLILKGDKTLNLVTGLHAPEQALFIEQQIRKS